MPTTVVSSIGTGGDYSTVQAWEDASSANLVTADQIWEGQLKNQAFTSVSFAISGSTTNSTCFKRLRCQPGASFMDGLAAGNRPLRWDSTNGASLSGNTNYGSWMIDTSEAYCELNGLQIRQENTSNGVIVRGSDSSWAVRNCIFETLSVGLMINRSRNVFNCLFVSRRNGGSTVISPEYSAHTVVNCTFVVPVGYTPGGTACAGGGTLKNCAMFGFSATHSLSPTIVNCATDLVVAGYKTVAYDTTTGSGFESITDATRDFRIKYTSALRDTGTADVVNAATDISGKTRSLWFFDIGCWENDDVPPTGRPTSYRPGAKMPRMSQPQGPVRSATLVEFPTPTESWLPHLSGRGVARGTAPTFEGTFKTVATPGGLGYSPVSDGRRYSSRIDFSGATSFAWAFAGWRDSSSLGFGYSLLRQDGAFTPVQDGGGVGVRAVLWPGVVPTEYKVSYDPRGKLSIVAGRGIVGVGGMLFSNFGPPVSFACAAALSTTANPFVMGASETSSEVATPWSILSSAVWIGAIPSDATLASLVSSIENHYRLFTKSPTPTFLQKRQTASHRSSRLLGTSDGVPATAAIITSKKSRAQGAQPQDPVGINRGNPITRGLALVESLGVSRSVKVGTKKLTSARGVGLGFGPTVGVGTTDSLETSLSTHSTLRSYFILFRKNSAGGGNLGRLWDKRTSGLQFDALMTDGTASNNMNYSRTFSGGVGAWTFPQLADGEHGVFLAHDASSAANTPVVYADGVEQTVSVFTATSGTVSTNTENYVLGNRKNDNARNWDGAIYLFCAWNRLLSKSEITGLFDNPWQLFFNPTSTIWTPSTELVLP